MKERPILFSGPMVRAILSGQKTVTRREVKKQTALDCLAASFEPSFLTLPGNADLCPYGRAGDRLWVRETWAEVGIAQADPDKKWLVYRECDNLTDYGGPWKPSIFMPRRACRILLEITGVRVERLQDISEEQALSEGIASVSFRPDDGFPICTGYMVGPDDGNTKLETTAAKAFAGLWSSINGAGAWDANPWVWVVEFKRVTP